MKTGVSTVLLFILYLPSSMTTSHAPCLEPFNLCLALSPLHSRCLFILSGLTLDRPEDLLSTYRGSDSGSRKIVT